MFEFIMVSIMMVLIFFIICYQIFVALVDKKEKSTKSRRKIMEFEEFVKRKISESPAKKWFEEQAKEDVYIETNDNLKLHAYEIINKKADNKWVILVHAYASESLQLKHCAMKFYENGYNILLLDSRACGQSEGEYLGLGYKDSQDLKEWITYLNKDKKNIDITLYGMSMGASAVLLLASKNLKSVKMVISDSAYSSVKKLLELEMKNTYKIPKVLSKVILKAVSGFSKLILGFSFDNTSTTKVAKKITVPTLIIHGKADKFVPYYMSEKLYNNLKCPKELLAIENANHCEGCWTKEKEYWDTVEKFLKKY